MKLLATFSKTQKLLKIPHLNTRILANCYKKYGNLCKFLARTCTSSQFSAKYVVLANSF